MDNPDFTALSLPELLEKYNELTGKDRRSKFESKAKGVDACEKAWSANKVTVEDGDEGKDIRPRFSAKKDLADYAKDPVPGEHAEGAIVVTYVGSDGKDLVKEYKSVKAARAFALKHLGDGFNRGKKYAKNLDGSTISVVGCTLKELLVEEAEKPAKASNGDGARKPRVKDGTIKILAKTCPYREGTDAEMHFNQMKTHPRVSDYLDQFENRKTARLWLWNAENRGGHVQVVAD